MKTSTLGSPQLFSSKALSALFLISTFASAEGQPDSASQETPATTQSQALARPHVQASSVVEAGRYLAIVAGCNDCHTEGYLQTDGKIPEADWLSGSKLGWRGPWGTTYPANLRLRVQEMSEGTWVSMLHTRHANPPMPWMNTNRMSDQDARALYQYIKSLGPEGEPVPQYVPFGKEPATPFISLEPQNAESQGASQQ